MSQDSTRLRAFPVSPLALLLLAFAPIHGAELLYVFGYFPTWGNVAANFTDTNIQLSGLMESYWTNFAKTGNPNSAGLPDWPRFGVERKFNVDVPLKCCTWEDLPAHLPGPFD